MGKDLSNYPYMALMSSSGASLPGMLVAIVSAVAVAALVLAAAHDAEHRRIPNPLSYALGLCGLIFLFTLPLSEIVSSLLLAGLVFACGVSAFARGWVGGGDVKLLTASMLWTGVALLPLFLTAMALACVGTAITVSLKMAFARSRAQARGVDIAHVQPTLPLGVAIGFAGILAILQRVQMVGLV